MMRPKVLKTEADYAAALAYVETLMDAAPGSPEEEELEVFALLIETYEEDHFPIALPDPIEAIQFRMEQAGLSRRDMVPYFGSQSRVSEVLNRRRPLSLAMMRALHEGLGIPAEVLLQAPGQALPEQRYNPEAYPFTEMFNRGYFAGFFGSLREAKARAETLLNDFFAVIEGQTPQPVVCRRSEGEINVNALLAWQARVLQRASEETLPDYDPGALKDEALRTLVRQSTFSSGPRNACELLNRWGISVIIEPQLPHTRLDGASFFSPQGRPIIGLTLRHDRLDNFWFTLLHELGHIRLHLQNRSRVFFDDTERPEHTPDCAEEREADAFAQALLIPPQVWGAHRSTLLASEHEAPLQELAHALQISPAIVAGRVRWETADYHRFGALVGYHQVREQFSEYKVEA